MERSAFDEMAALDEAHWWYRARRRILTDVIARYANLPAAAEIAEIGCGTGSNLPTLEKFGTLTAIEPDDLARAHAAKRSNATMLDGRLPDQIPLENNSLDLAVMLDVLEHLDDDLAALKAIAAKLKPSGHFILTVPAIPSLWSPHDEEHHHKRRYTAQTLRLAMENAGLKVKMISYFNTLLFPLIAGVRWMKKLTKSQSADTGMPPSWLNGLLENIFAFERYSIGRFLMPVGVSLIVVVCLADK